MRKRPVFVIFAAIFIGFLGLQARVDSRSASLVSFEILMVKRERSIRVASAMIETLVKTGELELIEKHLKNAIDVGWIDFYVLTFDDEVTAMASVRPLSDQAYATLVPLHPPNAFWEFRSTFEPAGSARAPASSNVENIEDFRFFEVDLGDKRRLKLGYNLNRDAYLATMKELTSQENNRILIITILIALGGFLFAARDLLRVAKIIQTKGVRGLRDVRIFSKEAAALRQGLEGFGEAVGRLEKENKSLTAQMLPSLRTELQSGRKPPYDFSCTMVRTDINNFTHIFHTRPVDQFLSTINEFFTACSHIISRYDGLIHEFVGDEIIYYFKEEQHQNTFAVALACAREIELVAEVIHRRTSVENDYSFRVKSGLSYGKIRFGPLLNGFSLAGAPLIETSRVLSAVSEKNENTIHFDSLNLPRIGPAAAAEVSFETNLKGMEGRRTILRYLGHRPISEILNSTPLISADVVSEYRSDQDLEKLLEFILRNSDSELASEAVSLFGRLNVTRCEPDFVQTLVRTARALFDLTDIGARKALATLSGSIARLVPHEAMTEDVNSLLIELVEHHDLRVVANTIETLQTLRDERRATDKFNQKLIDSRNARVAANAMVYVATNEISSEVVKRIRRHLDGADPLFASAALFAWGEIAQHHLRTDPVYFRTQTEFARLSSRFESTVARHPSVANQAVQAALKAGDTELSTRLHQRACA